MRTKGFKHRIFALLASTALFVVVLAGPAGATYKEGNISCQPGWDEMTVSTSSVTTWHDHYMEHNGTLHQSTTIAVKIWYGSTNYGTWSVEATPMSSGYASCT